MSKKGDAFLAELQALCERHQVEIRANRGLCIVVDDASNFSKSYGYVSAVEDHTTGEPVKQEPEIDTDIPEVYCGHCACNSCYEIKRDLGL